MLPPGNCLLFVKEVLQLYGFDLEFLSNREVISPEEMEPVVNQFMEKNLKMKTSSLSTLDQEFCQWPMLEKILMAHNSLSAL